MLEKLPPALGHLLEGQRAGLDKIVLHSLDLREGTGRLEVTSPAFADHAAIPARYTADGEGISPPLEWSGIPDAATSLALIVEDADSPTPSPLVHAIAVDIDRKRKQLLEGELHATDDGRNTTLVLGKNSSLTQAWLPPDPPPGHGPHRYVFQLFALVDGRDRTDDSFSDAPGRNELIDVLKDRAIASGWLIGIYSRDNTIALKTDEAEAAKETVAVAEPVLASQPAPTLA
jgi:Raf kinase inhibitor-like YbhB/YbcL family protein